MELFAFYNVENLFLPDPPSRHKLDPTVSGLRNWDERKYRLKLSKIAHVFRLIKEENGVLPCIIGLCEISGKNVLEDLVKLDPFNHNYGIVHYNSMDERKVDVALLYDKSKVEILDSEAITFFFEIVDHRPDNYDTTRDVLSVKLKCNNIPMNVFVAHLPSKREKDVNEPKRHYIMKEIRSRIISLVNSEKQNVILCGDFNQNPDDESLIDILFDDSNKRIMHNPFQRLYSTKNYSTYHYKSGLLFDQILLSASFSEPGADWSFTEAHVFNAESLSTATKGLGKRPFRTYAGTRYLGGYSDHYPVLVTFKENT